MEQPSLHNCGWLIGGEAWRVWIQFWTMIGWTEAPVSNYSSIVLWLILIRSNSRISCGLATDCKRKILQTKNEKWSFYSSYGAVEIKGKEAEVQPNIHWPFRCFFLVFTLRKISGSLDDELHHKFLHSLLQLVFLFLFHLPSGHPCVLVETVCRV